MSADQESERLRSARAGTATWRRWGPYLSERQWGTVREDYSDSADAWSYFTHDQARSRAYRWGEDGWTGIVARIMHFFATVQPEQVLETGAWSAVHAASRGMSAASQARTASSGH